MPGSSYLVDTNILLRLVQPDSPEYGIIRQCTDRLWVRGAGSADRRFCGPRLFPARGHPGPSNNLVNEEPQTANPAVCATGGGPRYLLAHLKISVSGGRSPNFGSSIPIAFKMVGAISVIRIVCRSTPDLISGPHEMNDALSSWRKGK